MLYQFRKYVVSLMKEFCFGSGSVLIDNGAIKIVDFMCQQLSGEAAKNMFKNLYFCANLDNFHASHENYRL
eukprot:TRINITY_DN7952_c0_g1_i1.p1 TRINITY_DN7952_c0_g1~~TRINITY_DN7952_c0_g1_i1.p1  ORF type:complete len:71 (+),score=6.78 TRINITY_DN7952_c0_g1_i1:200-412(+)